MYHLIDTKTNEKILIVYEKSKNGYSAYVPDLPGCTSAGSTREEIETNIIEAINLYIETLKEDGQPIPESSSYGENLVFYEATGIAAKRNHSHWWVDSKN